MIGLLDWLEEPRADRGIRFAAPGSDWIFVSYAQLRREVLSVAETLKEHGLERGSVVSLMLADERQFIAALFGCLVRGCVPSPIATPLAFRDIDKYTAHAARVMRTAGPTLVLSDHVLGPLAQRATKEAGGAVWLLAAEADREPPPLEAIRAEPAELALLQFTSGSSAAPKGVRVSWLNLESDLHAIHRWLGYTEDDATATWLPLYHDMGLVGTLLAPLTAGSDLWQMSPVEFVRSPARWLDCLGRSGATISAAPNFGFAYAARRVKPGELTGTNFSNFRVAIIASDRIDPSVLANFAETLRPFGFSSDAFTPAYGLAEATLAVTGVPPDATAPIVRLSSRRNSMGEALDLEWVCHAGECPPATGMCLVGCGRPLSGIDVKITNETGERLDDGHLGEIVVSSASVALGYQSRPGETSDFPSEGFRTGDAGFILDDELFVLGRISDSIKVRGQNLYVEDVELEMLAIEGVSAGGCAVALSAADGLHRAVVVVESDDTDWLPSVVALVHRLTDASVRLMVFRGEKGTIQRTSSGKTRRKAIWLSAIEGTLTAELIHDDAGWDSNYVQVDADPGVEHLHER